MKYKEKRMVNKQGKEIVWRHPGGKLGKKYQFNFNKVSLTNHKYYKLKTVEPIFADEINGLVVITVKVYYSNVEVKL